MLSEAFFFVKTLRPAPHRGIIGVLILSLLTGCVGQAAYMKGWAPVEQFAQRWSGGQIVERRLSEDEANVYRTLGAPEVIRFFRVNDTRQKVYEWIYLESAQTVWFLEGKRVDYVVADANTSQFTREQRDTVESKLVTGGILGVIIGGAAAGLLLYGDKIGLRDVPD